MLWIVSLVSMVIVLAGGLAHLLELPAKMRLPRDEYAIVQQIYRGWAFLGVPLVVALVSTLVLAGLVGGTRRGPFGLLLAAGACVALSLAVFFAITFPVNRETRNWTELPTHWEQLRRRWEYSHAINALIYVVALVLLMIAWVYTCRER